MGPFGLIPSGPRDGPQFPTRSQPARRSRARCSNSVERETGFEPATPSLEGWRSTAELFPQCIATATARFVPGRVGATRASFRPPPTRAEHAPVVTVVGRGGFEPPKAYASRFTVCPLWPLGYLPEPAGMAMRNLSSKEAFPQNWRWREDLNPRPTAYKAVALPLSYASTDKTSLYCRDDQSSRTFSHRMFR